ncbi:SIR2 family protein [Niveispirillum cyanobacteriorum]|uniref:Uncharacterized protein n=1 Tax=Niveispirillum cyanobacteriorum TaxID=1612173 RepID=A0A2K9NL64_9PROT|nr:SIR2 family protein [Niveispirillum cyanobacteriorum]AUN33812.1 hypothetical protein C0V82_25745 [Niveispirillum cyanobacteriorum]
MRFLASGPSIPDELLVARDEGRVVFFCGAGVSKARADLPDFYGLTSNVLDKLGAGQDSLARQITKVAQRLQKCQSLKQIGTIVSADKVFGFLEQEFNINDVRSEVAKALQPRKDADLSAHKILIDLARGPDGVVRLVTTNFDRLFQAVDPLLKSKSPPDLPDLRHNHTFDGIVHLHGMVNEDYTGTHGEEFVVSSADFGHAYLAEGWAANFMRQLLQRFQLVFVGYGADDPPVQYLLEALGRTATSTAGIYAFHGGPPDEAQARWGSKGVRPIAFDTSNNYHALWATLEAWAARARDPAGWAASIIEMAMKGPAAVTEHERGQVAHLVSTVPGARSWASARPPAEWLCTFDPAFRFRKPGKVGGAFGAGTYVDPFDLYGLDTDPTPPPINPSDPYSKREVPSSVWSAFNIQTSEPLPEVAATLTGYSAVGPGALTSRLWSLGLWLSEICYQPAAVWWAASRGPLHEAVQGNIRRKLAFEAEHCSATVKRAWYLLLGSWEDGRRGSRLDWYDFRRQIKVGDWTNSTIISMVQAIQPRLSAEFCYWSGPVPPRGHDDISLNRLISLDVSYPDWETDIEIPDEHLASVVKGVRWTLERAMTLEAERGESYLQLSHPLTPDPDIPAGDHQYIRGLDLLLKRYVIMYLRLHSLSPALTAKERCAWAVDDTVFARLRIWVAGQTDITESSEAGRYLTELSEEAFWDSNNQRDLLIAIQSRWENLSTRNKSRLTRKLLKGPERWEHETKKEFKERRAIYILERLEWLKQQGIALEIHSAKLDKLRRHSPRWKADFASTAAQSREARSGYVTTDTTPDILLGVPLSTLIDVADQLRGRDPKDSFREVDPFQGYVKNEPLRALAALRIRTTRGPFPSQSWRTFLQSEACQANRPRLVALISGHLARLPLDGLGTIRHEASRWIATTAPILLKLSPGIFARLWYTFLNLLSLDTSLGSSSVFHSSRGRDWLTEGINSPVGHLIEALLQHPEIADLETGQELPVIWRSYVNDLLNLPGDQPYYAIAILSRILGFLYDKAPSWTEERLFGRLDAERRDATEAFWAGFLGGNKPTVSLYTRIKPLMLARVRDEVKSETQGLAGRLLAGWRNVPPDMKDYLVTDEELRDALVHGSDEFRQQVLWNLWNWSRKNGQDNWAAMVPIFFQSVWPRQKAANSSRTTDRIIDILLSSDDSFPELFNMVSSCLVRNDRYTSNIFNGLDDLEQSNGELVRKFPSVVLELLIKVLPVEVQNWPHNVRAILKLISDENSALATDERMLILLRKLDNSGR